MDKEKKINKPLAIPIRSNGKIFNDSLFENFNSIDNVSDIQLLLSVISSYYINGEELPEGRTSEFTVKFLNNLLKQSKLTLKFNASKGYGSHLGYIRKHLNLYYETRSNWVLYEKGNKIIKDLVLNIGKKLHNFNGFRDGIVSHGQGAKLTDKERLRYLNEGDNKSLHSSANFVFPPSDYIDKLFGSLDTKLKDKNIGVYKKAAYIGSYTFLTHPFFDGNSRTSRMLMISYLDYNDKKFIKLYTFLATFLKDLPSYDDFLETDIYPLFEKIRDKVKIEEVIDEEGRRDTIITSYPDIEDYEEIIELVSRRLEKRIIKISKYIYENIESVNKLLKLISIPSNLKGDEKIVSNYFLKNIFDLLKDKGLNALFDYTEEIFILPDRFYKENKIESDIIKSVELKFLSVINKPL